MMNNDVACKGGASCKDVGSRKDDDVRKEGRSRKKSKILVARTLASLAILLAVLASLAFDSGIGTPSAFGVGEFFLLCPLGAVEAMAASKSLIPVTLISLGVVVLLALLFGRAWCAWGCPAPHIRRFFKRDPKASSRTSDVGAASKAADAKEADDLTSGAKGASSKADPEAAEPMTVESRERTSSLGATGIKAHARAIAKDSRTWVLVVVLAATFVLAFPIFCLVCPIGLTFGTVGSLWHLFVDKQVTLSVVVFPLALALELVLYRKWCVNICPIAGLLNIFGSCAKAFRPKAEASTCVRGHGADCRKCTEACPEGIDLHEEDAAIQLGRCMRCGECSAACPTKSISMGLR